MDLNVEDFGVQKKNNSKKITTIIIVIMVFILLVMAIIAGSIYYLKEPGLVISLNGRSSEDLLNIIMVDENNPSTVYIPIKKIARYFNYESFSGNYNTKSEENNQCYAQSSQEVAMFTLNSDIIYKKDLTRNSNYEYVRISEPVKGINGELCTTIDGIEKAFNVSFSYSIANKKMDIYTVPFLIKSYNNFVVNKGYAKISDDFNNQKAILDEMLVVEKGKSGLGVIDLSGNIILEPKYNEIQYLQYSSDFLVTSNGKKGIISKYKRTKLDIQYDNIELMDFEQGLYKIQKNRVYGIVNIINSSVVANLDYDEIGINASRFSENNITSNYIIAGKLIPVKKDNKWGFIDTKGQVVAECQFKELGYSAPNNKSGYSLLVIPGYNVIIVGNDNSKYDIMTTDGNVIWGFYPFDSIYMAFESGQTKYKALYGSTLIDDFLPYLDAQGLGENSQYRTTSTEQNNNSSQEQQNENNQEQQSYNTQENQNNENQEQQGYNN